MTLTKHVKDLHNKNFQSLKKEIEDLTRWNDFPCSWTGKINIININPSIAKTILNNKRTSDRTSIPDLKIYCRAIVIKTA